MSVYGCDEKPDSVLCAGSMCCEKQHITYMHRHIDRLQTSECVRNTMNREIEGERARIDGVYAIVSLARFSLSSNEMIISMYRLACLCLSLSLVSPTNDLNAQIQPEHIFL